jgi:hypothetical protein
LADAWVRIYFAGVRCYVSVFARSQDPRVTSGSATYVDWRASQTEVLQGYRLPLEYASVQHLDDLEPART